MKWNYYSKNELENIDFHDCIINSIKISGNNIIFELESVNILSSHRLNPYDVAKNTGGCYMEFFNVNRNETIIYLENQEKKIDIDITCLIDFEILKLVIIPEDLRNKYKVFGMTPVFNNEFSEILIEAEYTTICWNQFNSDAWFVNWPNSE